MFIFKIKKSTRTFTIALYCVTLVSCGEHISKNANEPKKIPNSNAGLSGQDQLETIKAELDAITYLARPTSGLAHINGFVFPVVSAVKLQSNHISFEVFRCAASDAIQGQFEVFDPHHPDLSEPEKAARYFSINNFWNEISQRCLLVKDFHPQHPLIDFTVPTGDWNWFLRPCIASGDKSEKVCSHVFTSSTPLYGFQNTYSSLQQDIFASIQKKIQSISTITASLPLRAKAYVAALDKCGSDDWEKATRSIMKSLVLNIVGLGSAIIFEIFAPKAEISGSWKERLSVIWQPSNDVQKSGQALTRVLLWLFSNQREFKKTCSTAEEIRISSDADLLRLKALQTELAIELDEAEREGIPLPTEVQQ